MDGSVHFIGYKLSLGGQVAGWLVDNAAGQDEKIKFTKYVKCLSFAPNTNLFASASADGTILLSKLSIVPTSNAFLDDCMMEESDDGISSMSKGGTVNLSVEHVKSLHLKGPVEALCFVNHGDTLCFYERDTSYLAYFDVNHGDFQLSKYSLNGCKCHTIPCICYTCKESNYLLSFVFFVPHLTPSILVSIIYGIISRYRWI
jgi:WD40 repeat protein